VRYSAAHLPLYAPAAPAWTPPYRLDVPAWLRTLSPGFYERQAMVVEQAEALRRQKQRQARDKGRTLSPDALSSSRLCAPGDDPPSAVVVPTAPPGALPSQMAD